MVLREVRINVGMTPLRHRPGSVLNRVHDMPAVTAGSLYRLLTGTERGYTRLPSGPGAPIRAPGRPGTRLNTVNPDTWK